MIFVWKVSWNTLIQGLIFGIILFFLYFLYKNRHKLKDEIQ